MPAGVTPGVATIDARRRGSAKYVQLQKAMYGIPSAALLFQEGNTDQPPNANVTSKVVYMAHLGSMDNIADGNSSYINEFRILNNGTIAKCFDGELHAEHKAATGHAIPKDWILLDNQLTMNVFCSRQGTSGKHQVHADSAATQEWWKSRQLATSLDTQFLYGIIEVDPQTSCHCAA
jgi:hypothetical protein